MLDTIPNIYSKTFDKYTSQLSNSVSLVTWVLAPTLSTIALRDKATQAGNPLKKEVTTLLMPYENNSSFTFKSYLYFFENNLAIEISSANVIIAMLIAFSITSGKICSGGTKGFGILFGRKN